MQTQRELELKQHLNYDPHTGIFTWRKASSNRVKVGDVAGSINAAGYLETRVAGQRYYLHRVALWWETGTWPEVTDHINGERADNRISNLRDVTPRQNALNRTQGTGILPIGVRHHPGRRKPFAAQITVAGKGKTLGYFHTAEEAHRVYLRARDEAFNEERG